MKETKLTYLPENNILSGVDWKQLSKEEATEVSKKMEKHIQQIILHLEKGMRP